MSGEQITAKELNRTNNFHSKERSTKSRVDINDLLYKVRSEKVREKKENYIFLGLVIGVLAVTGIIASL